MRSAAERMDERDASGRDGGANQRASGERERGQRVDRAHAAGGQCASGKVGRAPESGHSHQRSWQRHDSQQQPVRRIGGQVAWLASGAGVHISMPAMLVALALGLAVGWAAGLVALTLETLRLLEAGVEAGVAKRQR